MIVFLHKRARRNLVDGLLPGSAYVTETRRLLQNLYRQQASAPNEIRSYMVTSAARGEGKSTICSLLAIVSATIYHKRTLLVDGDLHKPTIHGLLGVAQGPGLFEIMRGSSSIEGTIRSTSIKQLWVIPSGYSRGAVDSYADEEFRRMLQTVRPNYDVIFVDAPPTVPAIEPILMADHVDSILLVSMAGKTPLAMVRRSMQILAPVLSKIAGVVLNNAAEGLPYYFNYSYYGYGESDTSKIRRARQPRQKEQNGPKPTDPIGGGS